jgi:hypothetical protein
MHSALDFIPVLTRAFLDAANQFVFLALGELQIVIGEVRKFLFQLAFGDVPVSFGGKSAHTVCISLFISAARGDVNFAMQEACRVIQGTL